MRGNEHTGAGPVRTVTHGQSAWPLCLSTWISHGPPPTLLLVFREATVRALTTPPTKGFLMKRLKLASLLAAVGVLVFAGAAHANGESVATFKNVSGDIGIARNGATLNAVSGSTLFVSDRIVSGTGSSAGIVFKDGTQLTLGPSTDIQVRDYAFEPKQAKFEFFVYLARGAAVYSSGMIAKLSPESVKVATPTATIGVRGTRFIIEAD